MADGAALGEQQLAFGCLSLAAAQHVFDALVFFDDLFGGCCGELAGPMLFDGGIDLRIIEQGELSHDVDRDVFLRHPPGIHGGDQHFRPVLAACHGA